MPSGANRLASLIIPIAIFCACLAIDLNTSTRLTSDIGRSSLLALAAAFMQLLVILTVVPWWSATLIGESSFGALLAAMRVTAMVVSTAFVIVLLTYLQAQGAVVEVLKVQAVVLGVGVFVVGAAASLRFLFRSVPGAAVFSTLAGVLLAATPFWGNILIQWANEAWKPWAIGFVVKATPLSACSSAVGYDLFRGKTLYVLSAVSDYRYDLPTWWLYALIAGAAGILLMELAAFLRRRSAKA